LPKNGLDAASSTETISWSEKSAAFWRDAITGAIHAVLSPDWAAA